MLAQMPRLLHDIVRSALESEIDVDLVSTDIAPSELHSASAVDRADVVILCEEEPASDDYGDVLFAHPRIRLIGISDRGRGAFLYELQPCRFPLGELSPTTLLRAVRIQSMPDQERC